MEFPGAAGSASHLPSPASFPRMDVSLNSLTTFEHTHTLPDFIEVLNYWHEIVCYILPPKLLTINPTYFLYSRTFFSIYDSCLNTGKVIVLISFPVAVIEPLTEAT